MPKCVDLVGQKIGKLTVIEKAPPHITKGGNYITMWLCKCDCGNVTIVAYQKLKNHSTLSCGCLRDENTKNINFKDHSGERYNRLTVIRYLQTCERKTRGYNWLCQCDCGNYIHANISKLKSGHTTSCGCALAEFVGNINRKYKTSNKRLYSVYKSMISRCQDNLNNRFNDYGGRGIKVCKEWAGEGGYDNFAEWALNSGYNPDAKQGECTLERKNVNGNYEPSNCCWITNLQQQNNKRNCVLLEHEGETHTVSEWSRLLLIPEGKLRYHIRKGRRLEEILKL